MYQAITRRSLNAGLMLGQRRRRWPNIKTALREKTLCLLHYHPLATTRPSVQSSEFSIHVANNSNDVFVSEKNRFVVICQKQ